MPKQDIIIRSIFGESGLTSAVDVADFDERVTAITASNSFTISESFVAYFKTKVAVLLKDNLLAGNQRWTSNNVESINHVFKQTVNWKPHMLPDLITKLQTLVNSQLLDARRAIYGRGNFVLRPSHAHFRVSVEQWLALSDAERNRVVKKCFVASPGCKMQKSTNGKLVIMANAGAGKKKNQVKRKRCARTVTPSKCNKKQCGSN